MATTIREMAIQYAPPPTDKDWNKMQEQLKKLSNFEAGANAVLEEIEKFANATWGARSLNTISLVKKIKELKK